MPNSPRASKVIGYGSSLPIDMFSEYLQEMNEEIVNDKYSGKEYGTWFNPTQNEKTAGVRGAIGSLGMGGYGTYQSYKNDRRDELLKKYEEEREQRLLSQRDEINAAG